MLDQRDWPRWAPATDGEDHSLFILGFGDPTRGNLRGLRLDAREVARALVHQNQE